MGNTRAKQLQPSQIDHHNLLEILELNRPPILLTILRNFNFKAASLITELTFRKPFFFAQPLGTS